jgi:hypothetical protein
MLRDLSTVRSAAEMAQPEGLALASITESESPMYEHRRTLVELLIGLRLGTV